MPRNIVIGQPVTSAKAERARQLRREMTVAEKALWQALRANRLHGLHFRRQQVVYGWIVDFYCHAAALAIEVDGEIHADQAEDDQRRDAVLNQHGIQVMRFSNDAVFKQLSKVLQEISAACQNRLPTPGSENERPRKTL